MKRSKFTEAHIAFVLKQVEESTSITEVCRKTGIAGATFFNWRKKYAGLMPSEIKRLKMLDEQNSRLNRLVADLSLDKATLLDVFKRKLRGLLVAGNLWMIYDQSGVSVSGVPTGC